MINGPPWGKEAAETDRAAIQGWGPTLRLLTLRAGGAACWITLQAIALKILEHVQ